MKNKIIFFLAVLLTVTHLNAKPTYVEAQKVVQKNFETGTAGITLDIDNRFGDIVFVEWDEPRVLVEVTITGRGKNQAAADRMMQRASVDFSSHGSSDKTVTCRTRFASSSSGRNYEETRVDYLVKCPSNANYRIVNKYGNVNLGRATKELYAEISYGNFVADRVSGDRSRINVKYGDIRIRNVDKLKSTIGYGKIDITEAGKIDLSSSYSKIFIEELDDLQIHSRYDTYTLDEVGSIRGDAAYTTFKIRKLSKRFDMTGLSYCKINIDKLRPGFESVNIECRYTPVSIGLEERTSFHADIATRYGSIKNNGIKFNNVTLDDTSSNTKSIKGTVGPQANPTSHLRFNGSYSNFTFAY